MKKAEYHAFITLERKRDIVYFKYFIRDGNNNFVTEKKSKLKKKLTQHEAHYGNIINVLSEISKMKVSINKLHIYSCNQVTIRQLQGEYKINASNLLKPNKYVERLIKEVDFEVVFHWRPKEKI
jgi:RNA binding exosome subunit